MPFMHREWIKREREPPHEERERESNLRVDRNLIKEVMVESTRVVRFDGDLLVIN